MARSDLSRQSGRASSLSIPLLLAACTVLTSACTSSAGTDDKKTEAAPTPTVSSSTQDPTEKAKADATKTYAMYWGELEKLYADPSGKSANVAQYAASTALDSSQADAKNTHAKGLVHTGSVTVAGTTVTAIDLDRQVPSATLSSCLDISKWQVVDATTKKPAVFPSTRLTKYVIVTTVERWPEGWRVVRDEPKGQPC
ncbi:hypothetical protein OHA84_37540 (plasmid) [Streptomyces sp. NBC_00513]|uniref:hypothetical protein n=1 Tax=unclassified Streptomyces TaxID=2593676 RepID=UPI002259972D|nr:hypothetical protein [Streptomyces sp. NBC_00424]MCX5078845.1 hypothetical protein [Streptomyces sp. NBC_00424]WUD46235.1 hypothetical protein OHA84_37540 [Streptomyces sp. NBC_00513]